MSSSAFAGLIFSSSGGTGTAWRGGGDPAPLACSVTRKPPLRLCVAGILIVKERVAVSLVPKVKSLGS